MDPGCLSRIQIFTHSESRILNPGSRISDSGSRIPDAKIATKERGEKNFVIPFYIASNVTKLNIILVLKSWRKKFVPIFKELLNFLPKKLSLSSQKYGLGMRNPEKTYSGSRIQGSKRHRIPDPQHWLGSGIRKKNLFRIRSTVNPDPRNKINIPDPQDWPCGFF